MTSKFLIYLIITTFSLSASPPVKNILRIPNFKIKKYRKRTLKKTRFSPRKKTDAKAQGILDSIINQRNGIKTVMIKSKVDIRKKFMRVKGNMYIYFTKDKILINTFVLGLNISTLMIKDNKIYFKDHLKNKLKIKRATKNNIAKYIPIKLSLKQFKDMLKGAPPVINYNEIKYNEKKKQLILKNGSEVQYIYLNSDNNIKKIKLYQHEKKRIEINFSDIKRKNGLSYFGKIKFRDYKKKVKSKMIITDIKFNENINPETFNIKL